MDCIENARHDLYEAVSSVETAIELLSSLERDGHDGAEELEQIIDELLRVKGGIERSYSRLEPLSAEKVG